MLPQIMLSRDAEKNEKRCNKNSLIGLIEKFVRIFSVKPEISQHWSCRKCLREHHTNDCNNQMAQRQKKHLRLQVIGNEKTGRTSTSSLNPNVSSKGPHLHHTLTSGKCCIPENQV